MRIEAAKRAQDIDAADRANKEASHQGRHTDLVDTADNNVNEVSRPTGNSNAYAMRKLRADRPDIHARVLAGETLAACRPPDGASAFSDRTC